MAQLAVKWAMKMRTSKNLLQENLGKLLESARGTRTEWKDDGRTSEQTKYIRTLSLGGDAVLRELMKKFRNLWK